jgi:hypothetical protein
MSEKNYVNIGENERKQKDDRGKNRKAELNPVRLRLYR